MSDQVITLNPQTTLFVVELVNAFGLTKFRSMYESMIHRHMSWNWGDDDDKDGWGGDGYKYLTLDIVSDGKFVNSANLCVESEYREYLEKHVLNASIYVIEYATSNEYDMKIEYLLDAGTEKEMEVELHLEMKLLGCVDKVSLTFDSEHPNAKYLSFLILMQNN